MARIRLLAASTSLLTMLCACGGAGTTLPTENGGTPQAPPGLPTHGGATATVPSAAAPVPTDAPGQVPFPLSESGAYFAGNRQYSLVDEGRSGREIRLTIWYPAQEQVDATGRPIRRDAPPDMSAAPYPLILTEPNSGNLLFKEHLVSHGFVMAIVQFPDDYDNWDFGVIDHPLDILFALDQIASNPPEALQDVIDSDHAGVAGYSWGGFYSLAVSGVRIDPSSYLAYCKQAPDMQPALSDWYIRYACGLADNWDEFAIHVGDEFTVSDDGLWRPVTDERIRAVMPMAPDGAWLYGERGLAMADRPVFIIEPAEDYQAFEAAYIFRHLGTPDLAMVSFLGKQHMMVFEPDPAARMKHFATAFFGYHLQGHEDYMEFFSEAFISQFEDLAWGMKSED